jgi:hypothetical protein
VNLLLSSVLVATGIALVSHFRYVLIARPGEPLWQRCLTWWVSPFATLLSLLVLMPLYFVAIASPRPQRSWGTRQRVEVGLDSEGMGAMPLALETAPGEVAAPRPVPVSDRAVPDTVDVRSTGSVVAGVGS